MSHNHAMLSYAAMMSGRRADAESSWAESMDYFPKYVMKQYAAFVDGIGGAEFEVKVRFGLWDEILEMPEPDEAFPLDRTIRHMARAISWAVKGDAKRARMEQSLFYDAKNNVPADEWGMPFSTTDKVIAVAEHLMNGEILLGEGDLDRSIQTLKKAAAAEDQLTYTEPPDWLMPPRHALGAVMIKAGRFEEAESVYREDLRRVRNNGWALYGLSQALRGQGKTGEADSNDAVFAEVWKHADTEIDSSCKCVEFQ
jgi:tetratricopeptide (TPR) repeat protein